MLKHCLRTLLTGALLATLAFSLALATSIPGAVTRSSAPMRAIGTVPLTFTNPIISANVRDLGDVAQGVDAVTTRYLRAIGGVTPYCYTINNAGLLGTLLLGYNNGAVDEVISPNGLVKSVTPGNLSSLAVSQIFFNGTVTDSTWALVTGTSLVHTESFRLNISADSIFRFANDQLCGAQTYRGYVDKLEAINGTPPYTFTITPNSSLTLNGQSIAGLEAVGLSLASDGTLFGRPYQYGTLQFSATCKDQNQSVALSRNGAQNYQTFTLPIASNLIVSSEMLITKLKVQHHSIGTTTLLLNGMVNMSNLVNQVNLVNLNNKNNPNYTPQVPSLAILKGQDLELRVSCASSDSVFRGSYVSPASAKFDGAGKIVIKSNNPPQNAVNVRATLMSSGQLKISIQDPALFANGGILPFFENQKSTDARPTAVFLRIGQIVMDANFCSFSGTFRGPNTSTYNLANIYGGDFMFLKVSGADGGAYGGTHWHGTYLMRPYYLYNLQKNVLQPVPFDISRTLVNIGADYVGKAGSITWGGGNFRTGLVLSVGPAGEQSGIPLAHTWQDAQSSIFGLKAEIFNSTGKFIFSTETSAAIFANGRQWTSLNPNK